MPESTQDLLKFDCQRTAVLIMDYQTDIVINFATEQQALLSHAALVVETARQAKLPVIYIVVGFRRGYPEVSQKNPSFSAVRQTGRFLDGAPGSEIHAAVAPHEGDIIVVKHRVSAFAGTDLEIILRANQIDTLVLFGITTSGVVLSTLRHAADADYRCFVLSDCCADRDEEVHRCLLGKVFPRQATVVASDQFLANVSL